MKGSLRAWASRASTRGADGIVSIRIGGIVLAFGPIWLVTLPVVGWLIVTLYIPVMGPSLSGMMLWVAAGLSVVLIVLSLVIHVLSHAILARLTKSAMPPSITVDPLGDASQQWPPNSAFWREIAVALSGPLANLIFAGLAYLAWDRQPHPVINVTLFLITFLNLGLALINFAPGFPFDGGRVARAVLRSLLMRPTAATRLVVWSGRLLLVALLAWGVRLLLQQAQFSIETGAGTIAIVIVLTIMGWRSVAWPSATAETIARRPVSGVILRALVVGATMLLLLAPAASLTPTLYGMRAPGSAVSVEQMVSLPEEYRHEPEGHFILTTVVSQTPIVVGQLAYAYSNPAIELVPPERVVPRGISPQELVREQYRLLSDSTVIAKIVALRLAGYEVDITGQGAEVSNVIGGRSDYRLVTPGDPLVDIDGESTASSDQRISSARLQSPGTVVDALVDRSGKRQQVQLHLTEPTVHEDAPGLDLITRTSGEQVALPFPVHITPQKIVGGPSAGLMFTLTIYNLLTPVDLTSGHQIAGTGTINLDGEVGPIGGVKQKVAAAEDAGARYFLVPTANAESAREVADQIQVVEVATVQEALEFLRNLPRAR